MRIGRYDILTLLLVMMSVLTSCREDLCYDHYPSIDVAITWEQEWERDYGSFHLDGWDQDYFGYEYDKLRPWVPEWVNVIRYFDDRRSSEKFLDPEGGKFIVNEDEGSSMLLYNGDTEYIVLSDVASLHDARASATLRSRAALSAILEKHPNARTTNPPDVLYSAFIDGLDPMKNHDRTQLPVKMQPLVYTYVITYEFEHGIEAVALARGALGGMAESVFLRTGTTSDESSIILFDCDIKSYGCHAQVRTFGVPGFPDKYYGRADLYAAVHPFTLNLELRLKNGNTVEFNYDISDQMRNQPRGGVIKITGIRIEDEQNQAQSGFEVDVDTWSDSSETIELPVGPKF